MTEWQPIETVPDGECVVLVDGAPIAVEVKNTACYDGQPFVEMWPLACWAYGGVEFDKKPTHWKPLKREYP
jgi:hypothetical protein